MSVIKDRLCATIFSLENEIEDLDFALESATKPSDKRVLKQRIKAKRAELLKNKGRLQEQNERGN